MADKRSQLKAELEEIEQALAAPDALPAAQRDTILAALRVQREALLGKIARVTGSGAIAQESSTAAGEGGVAVGRDVEGDVLAPGARKEVHIHGAEEADPGALRLAYLNRVFETAAHLSLAGVDPKAASSEADTRLNLGAIYTALLTHSTAAYERLLQDQAAELEMERMSALAQLDCHPRLVLLGEPGSGKSTFVNFVALCLAGEALGREDANLTLLTAPLPVEGQGRGEKPQPQPWRHGSLLPVCVVLRDFAARGLPPPGERASAEHLWRFLVAELEAAALDGYANHLIRELLKEGSLLLLDGLDEVPEASRRREQIQQAIQDFCATFGHCRILVTSRTYAYQKQDWRLPDFAEAVLAPFSTGQIRHFVERWYAHIATVRGLHVDDAQGRAELLKWAILNSDRLRGLAERPLLLTLMTSLHAWRGGSLPEKREELYADTVDLLLDWWESPKVVRDAQGQVVVLQPSLGEWLKVDRDKVRDLLNELAYQVHAAQPDFVGTADVLEGDLVCGLMRVSDNPDVKQARLVEFLSQRAGLLLPRGVGVYTFPHRTFQEYLAACYLTDQGYPDLVAELTREDPNRWREVVLLAGAKAARGTASAVWSLVDALCYEELAPAEEQAEADAWGALLAGQALMESTNLAQVSQRNRPKVDRVRIHLVGVLEAGRLPAFERAAAGRALAKLGDLRSGVGVDAETGLPDLVWCEVAAGSFLMGSPDDSLSFIGRETPQHEVELTSFRISKYPVTNVQYSAFVAAGGYQEEQYWTKAGWRWKGDRIGPKTYGGVFDLPNHPVVMVTWYEAVAFTRWFTGCLREDGALEPDQEVRLPTEAEWEKAARGTDGRIYPWGNEFDADRCNMEETSIGATSAVGAFPSGASPYGVQDLSGNVWEWCGTEWRQSYEGPADESLEGDVPRVWRGGAFDSNARFVRCAYRHGAESRYHSRCRGFRCVVVPVTSGL